MKITIASIIIAGSIIILRPFDMSIEQSVILAALLLTIVFWTTNVIGKTYASFFLLAVFTLFGRTPIRQIFSFPFSENFIMIVFSFIFSKGIANSRLADKLLQPILMRYTNTILKFFISIFIVQILMIFIIPQPFSRVIIIAMVFIAYFDRIALDVENKRIMTFWIYASSAFINMIMIRGDIILNNALITIANYSITEGIWIQYMLVPSLVLYFISAIGFYFRFKRSFAGFAMNYTENTVVRVGLNKQERKHLLIIALTVLLWASESFHGIKGTAIVVSGSLTMFAIGLLKIEDIKSVNIHLLVFLTATFSIGGVLKNSGVSDIVFLRFVPLFPDSFSIKFIMIVILTAVSLHMILGSNVTTMSVVVPGLLIMGSGLVNVEILMFIIYIAVCSHFVLPFHNVLMMIGNGNRHFDAEIMLRFAPLLTGIVVFSIFAVYLNWWRILGIL
ncbi:MAG: anion permease [Eubacteriales bacterium]|nr:anion permease [Eubacteriales bacterium]